MKFSVLAKYLEKLSGETKHSVLTSILVDLFKQVSKDDIDKVCYFVLGRLGAEFEKINTNLSGKMLLKAVSAVAGKDVKGLMSKYGDVGSVAYNAISSDKSKGMKVNDVYDALMKIVHVSGSGSQEKKLAILVKLYKSMNKLERKYFSRIVEGNIRANVGAMTILDALAIWKLGNKKRRKELEAAYNVCSDIGLSLIHI